MASRNGSGERFRSNRIAARSAQRRPPAGDRVVKVVRSDAGFDHSGGIQSAGQFLGGRPRGGLALACRVLGPRGSTAIRAGSARCADATGVKGAGTVSIAKLRDGRYLLIVGGENANTLDFYLSRAGTGLTNPRFDHVSTWKEKQLVGGDSEFGELPEPRPRGRRGGDALPDRHAPQLRRRPRGRLRRSVRGSSALRVRRAFARSPRDTSTAASPAARSATSTPRAACT